MNASNILLIGADFLLISCFINIHIETNGPQNKTKSIDGHNETKQ